MPSLEQIQAKLKKLQAQADVLIARKAQDAVDQIRGLMLKHGLTTTDIEAKAKARRAARGLNGHGGNGKVKAVTGGKPAKYRDHKTGATWTGHGRAPGWIANVKDRTQYLIEGAGELKSVAKAAVAQAKGGKGQPKGAQPPKYHNPKTGATWSGRGPAPAWLATVKDRSKFLIDSAAAGAKEAGKAVAKTAGKAKATATGAVSKKAAAKKVVAKKATAAKKTAAKKVSAASRKTAAVKPAAVKPAAVKPAAKKAAATRVARKAPGRKPAAKAAASAAAAAPQASTVQAGA
ncbi:H-NS histone family protein [Paraburkholderia bryophila]|uniref:H-NS family nucleoid-associated regulatory protein n=1 Tax=Paraburkholderia bryophila TaxID=420952 RepID=UPI00234ABAC1|nr:H-NS family nucleoid-associated regulatory protein [Paraburkholderia bryophila]WCM24043.1 H-NS histone family protein [Paraburkholderia bryophila]